MKRLPKTGIDTVKVGQGIKERQDVAAYKKQEWIRAKHNDSKLMIKTRSLSPIFSPFDFCLGLI